MRVVVLHHRREVVVHVAGGFHPLYVLHPFHHRHVHFHRRAGAAALLSGRGIMSMFGICMIGRDGHGTYE